MVKRDLKEKLHGRNKDNLLHIFIEEASEGHKKSSSF